MTSFNAVELAAVQAASRESLMWFTRYMFKARRGFKWVHNWHQDKICDALTRVYEGKCKRLIINIPPRYSKTEFVKNFIAWTLGKAPDSEFIYVSYSGRLASNSTADVRGLVSTPEYKGIFPAVELKADTRAKDHWSTTAGGVVFATGCPDGTCTGFGAGKLREGFGGAIIIDDPHKADEANSDVSRNSVIEWFQNTLESRANNPDTPIIVIMQRLHEDDLAGWLEAGNNGEQWEVLRLPVRDENGTPLWPWKHSAAKLDQMEKKNRYVFAGQYMQRPSPLGGGIYKDEWWKYYNPAAPPRFKRIIQTWDTAFKKTESADYSVCFTIGETDTGYYLIDRYKEKIEFPALKRAAKSLAAKYSPTAVLVEDKASGQSLIQELREDTLLPIVAIPKEADKISCAHAVTPQVESGNVFLPEGAEWVPDFLKTMGQFPNGAHDDDCDSFAQGIKYLAHGGGAVGLLDFMQQMQQDAEDLKRAKELQANG